MRVFKFVLFDLPTLLRIEFVLSDLPTLLRVEFVIPDLPTLLRIGRASAAPRSLPRWCTGSMDKHQMCALQEHFLPLHDRCD